MTIVHAPLQFPKGIKYKIFCSTALPQQTFKEVEAKIYSAAIPKKKSLRKRISSAIKKHIRNFGISRLFKNLGLKKVEEKRIKEIDEQHLIAALGYIIGKFVPSSNFLGYQTSEYEEINQHKIVLCQSDWPAKKNKLISAGWNKDNIIVMPVPESDYWSYWRNMAIYHPDSNGTLDAEKSLLSQEFVSHMLKNNIILDAKKTGEYRKYKDYSIVGIRNNTHIYPFPAFEKELINSNKHKIDRVIDLLSDDDSKNIYRMTLFGEPQQRLLHYITNSLSNLQYFQYIKLAPGSVIINVGLDSGFELPFFCAHMNGIGKVYNLDPFGYKYLSRYVSRAIEHFSGFCEENICAVSDKSGIGSGQELGNAATITIDDFVKQNKIERVDLIKMDIESMEELALPNMLETIKNYRPQLAIAVYHKPQHFWELPLLLIENCKDYSFYFNIYSSAHSEGILFAIPK